MIAVSFSRWPEGENWLFAYRRWMPWGLWTPFVRVLRHPKTRQLRRLEERKPWQKRHHRSRRWLWRR